MPEASAPPTPPAPPPPPRRDRARTPGPVGEGGALRIRPYHWLAAGPMLGLLGGLPFVNRVEPFVLGLPLLMAWIVGWVIATSVIMGVIYWLDLGRERAER